MCYKVGVKGVEIDSFRIASQFDDSSVFQMACGPHPISQICRPYHYEKYRI
jgi:hypothetical protein